MTIDYSKAKIYKIFCNITGQTYYGSTCSEITKRVSKHKSDFKCWKNGKTNYTKSYDIIDRGDYDYSLVEHFPCDSKIELHSRERYWIENNECINKVIPGRTQKEWIQNNKEKIAEQKKEYIEANKEKIAEQKKEYGEVKVVCGCGSEVRKDYLSKHRKTKKHITWVESQCE